MVGACYPRLYPTRSARFSRSFSSLGLLIFRSQHPFSFSFFFSFPEVVARARREAVSASQQQRESSQAAAARLPAAVAAACSEGQQTSHGRAPRWRWHSPWREQRSLLEICTLVPDGKLGLVPVFRPVPVGELPATASHTPRERQRLRRSSQNISLLQKNDLP